MNLKRPQPILNLSDAFSPSLDLYLNNASRSPLPQSHQDLLHRYTTDWYLGDHAPYYYNFEHADQLKNELSSFIHCSSNQIAIGYNVATGFTHVLHGMGLQPKDEVILLKDDYPSITLPFQNHPHINIQWASSKKTLVGEIESLITKRTRAVALSWVQYSTGQIQPIQAIGNLCKKHHIRLLVDATQALGVIPIDFKKSHVDYMVASLYKWCFCPPGIGVNIYSNSFLNECHSIGAGVFSQWDRMIRSTPHVPAKSAQKYEWGNQNILGILLAHQTFNWFNKLGAHQIYSHFKSLSNYILAILNEYNVSLPIQYNRHSLSSIVTFMHPKPDEWMYQLKQHGGQATFRQGMIRLSPGLYHTHTSLQKLHQVFQSI